MSPPMTPAMHTATRRIDPDRKLVFVNRVLPLPGQQQRIAKIAVRRAALPHRVRRQLIGSVNRFATNANAFFRLFRRPHPDALAVGSDGNVAPYADGHVTRLTVDG